MIPLASKCHGTWNFQWQPGSGSGPARRSSLMAHTLRQTSRGIWVCSTMWEWWCMDDGCIYVQLTMHQWTATSCRRGVPNQPKPIRWPMAMDREDGPGVQGRQTTTSTASVVIRTRYAWFEFNFLMNLPSCGPCGTVNEWQSGYELAICVWHIGFSGLWFRGANKGLLFFGRIAWNVQNLKFIALFKNNLLQNNSHLCRVILDCILSKFLESCVVVFFLKYINDKSTIIYFLKVIWQIY